MFQTFDRSSISCGATATLVEIDAPVDPVLEAAEIHRRVIAAGGPALLFTNVRGAAFPLVTNLFGTARRAELAFGQRPLQLIKRLVHLAETLLPPTPAKLWGARDVGARAAEGRPAARRARAGDRGGHRRRAARPAAGAHVLAGGRRPVRHAAARLHGASRQPRAQPRHVSDAGARRRARPACTGRSARAAASTTRVAEARGEALPVTVFLGGPPALILSAIAPLPENVPELMLASLIAGERLPLVDGPTAPHPLVADAEFALMGAGGAARRASPKGRSAITTATTRCGTTTRCFDVAADRAPARRDLSRPRSSASRGRRTSSSATCCRSCCRRCSRW